MSGVGAAATTLLLSLLPFGFSQEMYASVTVGASGAIYGLLVAFAMMYPDRPIYLYMLFPIPARVFVLIIGAVSFLSSVSEARGGVAHAAHLGGLVAGYLYLAWLRGGMLSMVRSQWLRWRLARLRRRFDVHEGGRKDRGRPPGALAVSCVAAAFVLLFLLGLGLRLACLPLPGTGDVGAFKIWTHAAGTGSVAEMYGVGGDPPERRVHDFDGRQTTVDYPPVALYELALVGLIYGAAVPGFPDGVALTVAVKLLPVAAEAGLFWLLVWSAAPGRSRCV